MCTGVGVGVCKITNATKGLSSKNSEIQSLKKMPR